MAFIDPLSRASNAARVSPSPELMARFAPELFATELPALSPLRARRAYWQRMLTQHLQKGDGRAAVVLSLEPVLVSCYADDFDAAVVVRFDDWVRGLPGLQAGSRLLSVNTFMPRQGRRKPVADLAYGPRALNTSFENFTPVVADFVSMDLANLVTAKSVISEPEWYRCLEAGHEYLQRTGGATRDGDFRRCARPAAIPR